MVEPFTTEPLFHEVGASWYWVLAGPIAAGAMLGIEVNAGNGPQLAIPAMFLVLVSGFLAVQVKAARRRAVSNFTSGITRADLSFAS